jgi:hypothetical protein
MKKIKSFSEHYSMNESFHVKFGVFNRKRIPEDINAICKKYDITRYTINSDGTVDVNNDVNLRVKGLTKLPLKFGIVKGSFDCGNNELTTLEGSPIEVSGGFKCNNNKLTSLEGSPREVGRVFYCSGNQLTTLEGGPDHVGGDYYCGRNKLTTLEGSPIDLGGSFSCKDNPVYSIYKLFPSYKSFIESLDYNYLRGTNIVKMRFKEALEELDMEMPEMIEGYNYI